jgi:hypothetical protein
MGRLALSQPDHTPQVPGQSVPPTSVASDAGPSPVTRVGAATQRRGRAFARECLNSPQATAGPHIRAHGRPGEQHDSSPPGHLRARDETPLRICAN